MRQLVTSTVCCCVTLLLTCIFVSSLPADEANTPLNITLGHAIERTLTANRQLASSYQKAEQSDFQVILNQGEFDLEIIPQGSAGYIGGGRAGAGPTVSGGVEFYKKFALGTAISIQPMLIKAAHEYQSQLNLSVTQPLLRGLGRAENLSALESAQFGKRSALRSLQTSQINTVLRTIQALYDVKRQAETVEIDKESLKRLQKFLEAAKRKEKIGLSDSLDVYRAEMEFKQAEVSLTSSQDRLQDAKDVLKDLLAYPLCTPITVEVPLEHHPITLCLEEAIAIALQYRQEVHQAWDQVLENRRLAAVTEKRIWPQFDLVVDYSTTGCDEIFTDAFCRRRESKWGIGFSTSTDLDRTPDKIAYQQSLYAVSDAERTYMQTRDTVTLDVKRAIRGLISTQVKMQNLEEQTKTAQGGLFLARIKYERGMGNNFDVIQAEKALQVAQVSKISSVIDHILGEYKLLAALGILGSPEKLSICVN